MPLWITIIINVKRTETSMKEKTERRHWYAQGEDTRHQGTPP